MASSSSAPGKYEVFLSFAGKDTRTTFTNHLNRQLLDHGVKIFLDDADLARGEDIKQNLTAAIQDSDVVIPIISESFADSSWCLDELVEISKKEIIIPVFYYVDPSDVRSVGKGDKKRKFDEAFRIHEEKGRDKKTIAEWAKAMKEVANRSGYHIINGQSLEGDKVREIVEVVKRKLNKKYRMDLDEQLVGMESHTKRVMEMLHIQCDDDDDVRMIGIWGMGGLGKTTLAKKVYNQIMQNFQSKCFLQNVRHRASQTNGVVELQKQLIRQLDPAEKNVDIDDTDHGIIEIQRIVGNKRVLIVLDDVDDQDKQLKYLARKLEWFGHGSRILITTRDRTVLESHKIKEDMIVAASSLDESESLQLFCRRHAFDHDEPPTEYKDLSQRITLKLGGLPLAIKVVASDLSTAESIKEWEEMARHGNFDPEREVESCLKISYDKLNKNEKYMFLDIACLLIGYDVREVTYMWDACGYCPERGLKRLKNKCLVEVDKYGELQMHDLLRDMGRNTVVSESLRTGELQSRIWIENEAGEMLKNNKGTSKVEGLRYSNSGTTLISDNEIFDKWSNLRLLFLNKGQRHLPAGLNFLSSKLKWLEWEEEREEESDVEWEEESDVEWEEAWEVEFRTPDQMDLSEIVVLKCTKSILMKVWDEICR